MRLAKPQPLFPPREQDDLSTHGHRQLIGWVGATLPAMVWIMSAWRPTPSLTRWGILPSISAYYYTGAVTVFVGALVALSAFLITYRGYDNVHGGLDRTFAVIASVSAFGVAFFPTSPPNDTLKPVWWWGGFHILHLASAAVLFGAFAFFALVLFPKRQPGVAMSNDKKNRNRIYKGCGYTILACMGAVPLFSRLKWSIFYPEAGALVAFAMAWLTKGHAMFTVVGAGRRAVYFGKNPKRLLDDTWATIRGGGDSGESAPREP